MNTSKYVISLSKNQYYILLAVTTVIGGISLFVGLKNAWVYSVDFQVPSACLFIEGENPYRFFLDGLHGKNFSPPNYLHSLYFLLSPLCLFNLEIARIIWALVNTGLAVMIAFLLYRAAGLKGQFLLILMFFFASLPFRNGIGNDQNQLFVLFFFVSSMLMVNSSWNRGLLGALSFAKYSFAPAWIGMVFANHKKALLWSVIFISFFTIVGAIWIRTGDFFLDLLGPIKIASKSVAMGQGDLLTIVDYIIGKDYSLRMVTALFLMIINIAVVILLTRNSKDYLFTLAISCTSSLMFVTHLGYDAVFLLPAFIYLISRSSIYSAAGLFLILYFWQIIKALHLIGISTGSLEFTIFHFISYFGVMYCVYMTYGNNNSTASSFLVTNK